MRSETASVSLMTASGRSSAPITSNSPDDLLTSTGVKVALGNISEMTLWRWLKTFSFPPPDLIVARRKFWRRSTVQAWIAAQAEKTTTERADQRITSRRREVVAVAAVEGA
jgi:predicted DNA-binding transcriptional regulator AlpA